MEYPDIDLKQDLKNNVVLKFYLELTLMSNLVKSVPKFKITQKVTVPQNSTSLVCSCSIYEESCAFHSCTFEKCRATNFRIFFQKRKSRGTCFSGEPKN